MLGILVAVLGFFAVMMWVDAHNARDAADRAAAKVTNAASASSSMPGMAMSSNLGSLTSYAGAAPANADGAAFALDCHTGDLGICGVLRGFVPFRMRTAIRSPNVRNSSYLIV